MSLWPHSSLYPPSVKIRSWSPTSVSYAHSGQRQARSRGAHKWHIKLTYPPRFRADLDPIWAFAAGLQGQYDTCTIIPSYYSKSARGSYSGGAGTGSAGANVISVTGSDLVAGDFIKFASHDKVYQAAEDLSGGNLHITPALIETITSSAITYDDVQFTVACATDFTEISQELSSIFGFEVDLIEVP